VWMVIWVLAATVVSYGCDHTVLVDATAAQNHVFDVAEGAHVCINSSLENTGILIQAKNLGLVRYYDAELTEIGSFVAPSEVVGVSFGNTKGHLEIDALLSGKVAFATMVWPSACDTRLVTTLEAERLKPSTIGKGATLCVWYPFERWFAEIDHADKKGGREAYTRCTSSVTKCDPLFPQQAVTGQAAGQFLVVNTATAGQTEIRLRAMEDHDFLKARLDLPMVLKEIPVLHDAEHEKKWEEELPSHRPVPRGLEKRRRSKRRTGGDLLLLVILVLVLVLVGFQAAQFFSRKRWKKASDGSEERLLTGIVDHTPPEGYTAPPGWRLIPLPGM